MQRWMLATMLDTVSEYLYDDPGRMVTVLGEAFQLRRCQPIEGYLIHWNRTYNGTCYETFTVTSSSFSGPRFLELRKRTVTRQGNVVHCSLVTADTYVSDKNHDIWHLQNLSVAKVTKCNVTLGDDRIGLVRVASFEAHLQHHETELPSQGCHC